MYIDLMGTVLISLDEKHEALLRQLAQEKYGSKKGSVSAVVQEALDNSREMERSALQKEAAKKQLRQMLQKGLDLGFKGKVYEKREELYD